MQAVGDPVGGRKCNISFGCKECSIQNWHWTSDLKYFISIFLAITYPAALYVQFLVSYQRNLWYADIKGIETYKWGTTKKSKMVILWFLLHYKDIILKAYQGWIENNLVLDIST